MSETRLNEMEIFIVVFVEINTHVFNKTNGKYTSISQYFGCTAVTLIRNDIWQYLSASIIFRETINMSVKMFHVDDVPTYVKSVPK
jgi:hypothetical protein